MSGTDTADAAPAQQDFRSYQERNRELFGPSDMRQLGDGPFTSRTTSVDVGAAAIRWMETGPSRNLILPQHRRHTPFVDHLNINIVRTGQLHNDQLGRRSVIRPGDICIADNRYERECQYRCLTEFVAITVPRERLERLLGPTRVYAGLVVGGTQPTTQLARHFVADLLRARHRLTPEAADRMMNIGIDLLVTSVAERLSNETPAALRDTVLLQRARMHIEAHLADPALAPSTVASAMAISLRSLQSLFEASGRSTADWIWTRRLEVAAQRLADPGYAHLSIGVLSAGCGFTNQAHFSRRFRHRFGLAPSDYRHGCR